MLDRLQTMGGRLVPLLAASTVAMTALGSAAPDARAAGGAPFFSEYIEGPSTAEARALEIYNPGPAPIDLLAGYAVTIYSATGGAELNIQLVGTLEAGDVFVLAHPASVPEVIAQADQQDFALQFTGRELVALRHGSAFLDFIGQWAFDPGAAGYGQPPTSTTDSVLRRKPSVTTGDTNGEDAFDPASEWDGFSNTDYSGLGTHAVDESVGSASGTVDADVTMAASAACLELSTTSISFGTLGFGAEDQPATPSVTLTNCATVEGTLLASASNASGSSASWSLVDSAETCADTLGTDQYRLNLQSPDLAAPASLSTSNKQVQTLAAGAATEHTAHIFTPCAGSSGDGETLTFQISYLATE